MSNVRIKLTDGMVAEAALPPGKSELVLWDSDVPGFGMRLRGGSKTFIVAYRPVGAGRSANMRRVKIGQAAALPSLKEARRLARALLGKVAAGEDPARERADRQERKGTTIAALLERYEKSLQRRGYVARNAVLSLLRRRLAPLLDRDAGTVTGWQLAEIVEGLEEAGARAAAATFRTRCSTFLNWCAFEARAIEANPLAGYRRGRDTRQERVAKSEIGRALTDDELAAVWRAADATTSFGRLVRFLILTGCRRGEGANLLWSMVDRPQQRIDLPPTFTKQARGHTVYVSGALGAVLSACERDARSPDLVFPSARSGGPLKGWSKIMDRADVRSGRGRQAKPGFVKATGVDFTLHDLRRTFRTGLSRLGVDRDIAELALGHARADLEARYNRDDCEAALRAAFEGWAAHVETITS